MRVLSHFRTMEFYDEPLLFVAHDQLDTAYICLLVEKENNSDKYICVAVSRGKLNDFLHGSTDLLSIIKNPETQEVFLGTTIDGDINSIAASIILEKDIKVKWLPEPGFFIKSDFAIDGAVIKEAVERQRAVIHYSLNPPEAREQSKVSTEHLSQAIKVVQRVIHHAYRKALRDLNADVRELVDKPENYQLEVFSFSPGSFTLHMQTASQADLLGYSQIARALEILDKFNENLNDPEATVQKIAGYGGHLATAYRDLLQFIIETKTPITYEWAMPDRNFTVTRRISNENAQTIYNALVERTDIGKEEKLLVGTLKKADKDFGTWRLLSEIENREYNGRSEAKVVDLAGLVIDARYEFHCEEQLSEERGTGKETTTLYLKTYRLLK